jgi:cell division protein FtsL
MDIEYIYLVIALAVLAVTIEFNLEHLNRHIGNWQKLTRKLQSALDKKEVEQKEIDELRKQREYVESLHKRMKIVTGIRQLLPILLTIEVGHITLQSFQWSRFYEWRLPGLNKVFLIVIIVIILVFFIIRVTLSDKKISEYEYHNWEVMVEYKLNKGHFL